MCYDPANIAVVGVVRLPQGRTLQEAIAAQRAMPAPRGRAAKTGWLLRPTPRAPPPPRDTKHTRGAAKAFHFKKK